MTTLLLITLNEKERKKTNINDIKPCSATALIENTWDSFLGSIKIKCQNCNYNLRLRPQFEKLAI